MDNSFKRNLLIGYGVSLFLLIMSAVASYISIDNLLYSQKLVNHTNTVINKLENIISTLNRAESGQRGFLITDELSYLNSFNADERKVKEDMAEVKKLTSDNPAQRKPAADLEQTATKRFDVMHILVDQKKRGADASADQLKQGKDLMDEATSLVQQMESREQILLISRTETLNKFNSSTPSLIIVASLLGFFVTIISFFRVNNDFEKRGMLQKQLQKKDEEISKRIDFIQSIADKISSGNYKMRVTDEGTDLLGSLASSLNKMTDALDVSFTNLTEQKWLQTGIAKLNDLMLGEKNISKLSYAVIEFITEYTRSQIGAFYVLVNDHTMQLAASIAVDKTSLKSTISLGEGLAGQCGLSEKEIMLDNISDSQFLISSTSGNIKPNAIFIIPVLFEKKLKGVIEIASTNTYNKINLQFVRNAVYNIGMALSSAKDHENLQELLAETRAQSEELQAQQTELENNNAELETQSEKLQTSEEELRVQQEELQETNLELEERSRLLEEKNELILERNLQIQSKADELEKTTKYKSEFLANMSHELRTPLNSILLLSRILSENHSNNLTADQIESATVIKNSGQGLLSLIDEILDLSKIEAGKMEAEYNFISLAEVTNEINSLFKPIAEDKGIIFKIEKAPDILPVIETDKFKLQQILRNLVSNALKFTAYGSVTLKLSADADKISFAVIDTGIGIAKEKSQTVFEAFQQADGSTRRKFGGTGLGLSISRELAKLLGGDIYLQSEENRGSIFTLILPIQKKDAVYKTDLSFQEEKFPEKESESSAGNEKYISQIIPASVEDDRDLIKNDDKVILIIEDDVSFARSLLDYTRQKGYKGVVAVRGDEGIELAGKYLPLGILLDIQLPVKSGWEVMEQLKSDRNTRQIPVHIMSSYDEKNKSLTKGAVDFINKPLAYEKLNEVFEKIEDALRRYPKKVLIIEENAKHAQALSYFLENFNIISEIKENINDSIKALTNSDVNCVILDMGIPTQFIYTSLEEIKKTPGLEDLPIIIFTGRNLSQTEEMRIKKYAASIVIKTAHSYQRILDEVSLFLHLVEENKINPAGFQNKTTGKLKETLKDKTLLIADDDVRNIFSLSKALETYGMNIISATDGREAIHQLNENPQTNLVLMDMMMPEMDGYEAIKEIRKNNRYRNLPVLAVTAKAMVGDRDKCISAGASDYITKPVDIDQLTSLLRVWLY